MCEQLHTHTRVNGSTTRCGCVKFGKKYICYEVLYFIVISISQNMFSLISYPILSSSSLIGANCHYSSDVTWLICDIKICYIYVIIAYIIWCFSNLCIANLCSCQKWLTINFSKHSDNYLSTYTYNRMIMEDPWCARGMTSHCW